MNNFKIARGEKTSHVIVEGLSKENVGEIIKSINFPETKVKFFDFPIYCKAIRNLTPGKSSSMPKSGDSSLSLNTSSSSEKGSSNIPGLTKSQKKKALKKARERKNKAQSVITENGKNPKSRLDFLKKDLVKCGLEISDIENEFVFDNLNMDEGNYCGSKFFQKSPMVSVEQTLSQKRLYSPENSEELRKTKQKQK